MQERALEINNDGRFMIAVGKSRKETQWKNQELLWSELVKRLSTTTRTRETFNEYRHMTKERQSQIKDVGGFCGGVLKSGRRKAGQVAWRSLLTLDADYADDEFLESVDMLFGSACVIYSTHSHSKDRPRYRLVAPLARQVTADEYKALSRFVASSLGMDTFDDSTYEPERLMYWPSTASDGDYVFVHNDGQWLDPDDVFRRYPMWEDASTWPESSRAQKIRQKHADKQGDPRDKDGVIGAFCRTYTVSDAIDEFLSDVYIKCDVPNRYTYIEGTASAGLVVYDDELFAFSHHGSDPTGGMLCNAFDLVRIHIFGIHDEDAKDDTPINRLPSYQKMIEFCLKDDDVKIELAEARAAEAMSDFDDGFVDESVDNLDKPDNKWKAQLSYSERGGIIQSIDNVVTVMRNDHRLKGVIGRCEFTRNLIVKRDLPWRKVGTHTWWSDSDDSALRHYLEKVYGLTKREVISDAFGIVISENRFHPVRDYLDGLVWDGVNRLDTLLIDYLGVEDTAYTRAVSRKWLIGAVSRIREPGCKFDTMLILVGLQGVGKSQFFNRLARQQAWFSDSVARFDNSKESMEQLAGKWIIEVGELSVMKRSEVEHVKVFLAKQVDSYRPSYGRQIEMFPRQCIFGGTTNRDDFLQDATGNRRFWPVEVTDTSRMWSSMTPEIVDQIWAEADVAYMLGESLYLDGDAKEQAGEVQERYTEAGGKIGIALEYLERKVPSNWMNMSSTERLSWLNEDFGERHDGEIVRERISGIELFVECFGGKKEEYSRMNAYELTDILTKCGWKRSKNRTRIVDYGQQRCFFKV